MDLNQMVMNSMTKMEEEGKIQAIIDTKLEKTVTSIVDDMFGQWSDFSKELKANISEKLAVDFDTLDLSSYNTLIAARIKEVTDREIEQQGLAKMDVHIERVIGVSKKEWKLSELVAELKSEVEGLDELGYEDTHEMTMIIDDSFSLWTSICLDAGSDISQYDCRYRFNVDTKTKTLKNVEVKDGKYSSRERGEKVITSRSIMRGFYGLEEILFKMYTQGSTLIIDEDDCELEVSNPEYD